MQGIINGPFGNEILSLYSKQNKLLKYWMGKRIWEELRHLHEEFREQRNIRQIRDKNIK